jgi:hypothetical protein
LLTGCVRWGVTDEDEDSDGTSTSTSTSSTSTSSDVSTTATTTPDLPPQWPDLVPIDPNARVIAWGKTGIPTRNLDLYSNFFRSLAGPASGGTSTGTSGAATTGGETDSGTMSTSTSGASTGGEAGSTGGDPSPGEGSIEILWIATCDPRQDELGCLAGNVTPFFDMVDALGTIEFQPLAAVDARAYDVVVADFCGPVDPLQVLELLGDGGHVLLLGDRWCSSGMGLSADVANDVAERIGIRFTERELYNHNLLVPDTGSEILEGIDSIDAWGITMQEVGPGFAAVVQTGDGALITTRTEE